MLGPEVVGEALSVSFATLTLSSVNVEAVEVFVSKPNCALSTVLFSVFFSGLWVTVSLDEHELSVYVLSSLLLKASQLFSQRGPSWTLLSMLTLLQLRDEDSLLPPDTGLEPLLHLAPSFTWGIIRCALPARIIISAILNCRPGSPFPAWDETGLLFLGFFGGKTKRSMITSLLGSTLVGYALSFAPETLHFSQAIDSSLHRESPVPKDKMGKFELKTHS